MSHLFSLIQQHKTTLGEAEIQSAVEAAAVIFKKVVLQRRAKAKKANEEGKLSFYPSFLLHFCRKREIIHSSNQNQRALQTIAMKNMVD